MIQIHRKRSAFTLIEIMIVIGIIALLAALTLGISSSVLRNAEKRKTEDALKILTMALQEWELERGRPMTYQGYGCPDDNGAPMNPRVYSYDIVTDEILTVPAFGDGDWSDTKELMMNVSMIRRNTQLALLLKASTAAKEVLSKISPDLWKVSDEDGENLLVDAWGNPLGVVFPGAEIVPNGPNSSVYVTKLQQFLSNQDDVFIAAQDRSGDNTVRDSVEDGLGSCINQRPYFVSAGPDGLWGYRFQSNATNANSDNVYFKNSEDNIYSYEPYLVEGSQ